MAVLCQFSVEGLCCICITTGCIQAPSVCGTHYGDGSNLTNVAGTVPTGSLVTLSNSTGAAPTGYLCTNTCYTQSSYPTLYSCIGLITDNTTAQYGTYCCCIGLYNCANYYINCATLNLAVGKQSGAFAIAQNGLMSNYGSPRFSDGMMLTNFTHSTAYFSCTNRYLWLRRGCLVNGYCNGAFPWFFVNCAGGCIGWTSLACSVCGADQIRDYICYTTFSDPSYGQLSGPNWCPGGSYGGLVSMPMINDGKCRAVFFYGPVVYSDNCTSQCCTNYPTYFRYAFTANGGCSITFCACAAGTGAYIPRLGTCSFCAACQCHDYGGMPLAGYNQKCDNFWVLPTRLVMCSPICGLPIGRFFCSILQTSDFNTWCAATLATSVCCVNATSGTRLNCTSTCAYTDGNINRCFFGDSVDNTLCLFGSPGVFFLCCDPVTQTNWLYNTVGAPNVNHFIATLDTSTNCMIRYRFCDDPALNGFARVVNVYNGRINLLTCDALNIRSYNLANLTESALFTAASACYEAMSVIRSIDGNSVGTYMGVTYNGINFTNSLLCNCYGAFLNCGGCCQFQPDWSIWPAINCRCFVIFPACGIFGSSHNNWNTTIACNCCLNVQIVPLYQYNTATTFKTPPGLPAVSTSASPYKQYTFIKA